MTQCGGYPSYYKDTSKEDKRRSEYEYLISVWLLWASWWLIFFSILFIMLLQWKLLGHQENFGIWWLDVSTLGGFLLLGIWYFFFAINKYVKNNENINTGNIKEYFIKYIKYNYIYIQGWFWFTFVNLSLIFWISFQNTLVSLILLIIFNYLFYMKKFNLNIPKI